MKNKPTKPVQPPKNSKATPENFAQKANEHIQKMVKAAWNATTDPNKKKK